MRARTCLSILLVLASAPAARAEGPEPLGETLTERAEQCHDVACVPGVYFFRYEHLTDFALDPQGHQHGVVDGGEQRLRLRPHLNVTPSLFLEAEADIVTGRLFGDVGHEGDDFLLEQRFDHGAFGAPVAADFRQLYLQWTSPIGLLRVGQQASQFGLGLVANDGNDEAGNVFGDPRLGDLSERALFATKPLKAFMDGAAADAFILAGGFDVVYRDDNASLRDGDLAMQGIVSLMWRTELLTAGVYVAIRDQDDEDGDTLSARAYDLFVRWVQPFESIRAKLTLAAEAALIHGTTDRVMLEQARSGVTVLGVGAVLRGTFELEELGLATRLEVGFASGDNNRNDDLSRSFSFDPAYQVGMILFQEALARISTHSVLLARDPSVSASAPKGLELTATNGSVTNTVYLNPIVRYEAPFGLRADLGALFAWSAADVIDPWASAQRGGFNTTYLGQPGDRSHYYGTELDLGLAYAWNIREAVVLQPGVQAGVFFPGGVFEAPEGGQALDTVAKVRANFDLRW